MDRGCRFQLPGLGCQLLHGLSRQIVQQCRVVGHLQHHDGTQLFDDLLAKFGQADPAGHQPVDQRQPLAGIAGSHCIQKIEHSLGVDGPQHLLDLGQRDLVVAKAEHLVKQADGVAHAALGAAGNHEQRLCFGLERFFVGDVLQMLGDFGGRDPPEVEALAAAEHRGWNFVWLGGGQNKTGMWRGFFQRFEQSVEGAAAQHMDFVDDINFEAPFAGAKAHLVAQLADIVHAVVGGRVDLDQVNHTSFGDCPAGCATVAGALAFWRAAVEGLGQDAGRAGLAGAAWPGEQIGVGNPIVPQRVLQRAGHVFLADDFVECLAAPFTIECSGHESSVPFNWADSKATILGRGTVRLAGLFLVVCFQPSSRSVRPL